VTTTVNAWRAIEPRYARLKGGKIVRSVRLNHLRAALLPAAAGLLAAVGLVVIFYAQPAESTPPGKPGKIAYSGKDAPNGDFEIYTIKSGGGGKVPVTDNTRNDYNPAYSPSGKQIVYSASDGQDSELYKINAGGGGRVQLTDNGVDDHGPSYSPSGKKIAYSGLDSPNTASENFEIYTINAGGGGKVPVTDTGTDDDNPSWGSS
jgi:dipeptidyl aminopeptidase/acylaminoacyl peptidase